MKKRSSIHMATKAAASSIARYPLTKNAQMHILRTLLIASQDVIFWSARGSMSRPTALRWERAINKLVDALDMQASSDPAGAF